MFGLLDKVYNGTTDVFTGAGGFLSDVLRATRQGASGNVGEAAETIMGSVEEDLMGGVMGGLFGPEGIGGGIIGAVPEGVRSVARPGVNAIFGAWDWTIQEVVDRPLGTIATMVSPGNITGNPIGLLDPRQWVRAYSINDKRTFGQSFIAGFYFIDPFDQDEYNSIKDDPIFNLMSGTADFAQEFLDPVTYFGGGAVKLARGSAVIGKAGSGVGRTFANPTRFGGHLLPRTGDRVPQYVLGRELGYRPSTILGREVEGTFGFLTKNKAQKDLRDEYISTWTKARAEAVLDSPEWNRINDAIEARPKLGGNERFGIFRRGLGRRGTKLPNETLRLIANGPTREARARTFRMFAGDNTVWREIHRDALAYRKFLANPEGRQAAHNVRSRIDLARAGNPLDVEYTGQMKSNMDDMAALADSTDWALIAAFEDSLILSQQKKMAYDPMRKAHFVDDSVFETLKEVPVDTQIAALDELLGIVDDSLEHTRTAKHIQAQQRYAGVSIKELPKGKRFAELLARHRDELMTNDFVVSEYINPRVIGGRNSKIRLLSAKISRTHINHKDSGAFNAFETMLADASRMEVNGVRAITAGEVDRILGEYQAYLTEGQWTDAGNLFARTNERLMAWVDDQVDYGGFKDATGGWLDGKMRTMTDDYKTKQDVWKDTDQNEVLSVTDFAPLSRKNKTGRSSIRHEKDADGNTLLIHYGMAESQLRDSDIIPRYDVVQSHLERAIKRQANEVGQTVDDMLRQAGAKFQVVLEKPQNVWRSSVLLTPKWPMRVGLDEQLRLMVNLGTLNVVAEFNVGFGRMRRSQEYSRLKHDAGAVADVELLSNEMHKIVLRDAGVDTTSKLPLEPIYDPVVEELVRGDQVQVHYLDDLTPEQGAKLDELKGDHEIPDLEPDVEVEIDPSNLTEAERAAEEAKLVEARERGARRWSKRKIQEDIVKQDFKQTKKELERLAEYSVRGQPAIPKKHPREPADAYRARLERELNDRYKRQAAEKKEAKRRAEEPAVAAEQPEFGTPTDPLSAPVRRKLREETIQGELGPKTPVFEIPENVGKQRRRMADIRPDINFLGINFRQRTHLPKELGLEQNQWGHYVSEGYMPGEVLLDPIKSYTFRMPNWMRAGARHPERGADWDLIQQRIKNLEEGQKLSVGYRTARIPQNVPPEYADLAGLNMRAYNRMRSKSGLDELTQDEFIDFIEEITGEKQIRSGAEAQRLEDGRNIQSGDPVDQAKVAAELTELRSQLDSLSITAQESVDFYRAWVTGETPVGASDEYMKFVGRDQQYSDTVGPRRSPLASEVRQALARGDLNGTTLLIENLDRPHHGRVLNELQVKHDPRPVVKIAVTGSDSIQNADYIWAVLDDIWIKNSQKRRLELVVMPTNTKAETGLLDGGKGIDHIAKEWAKDRGVAVQVRAIFDDTRYKPGMDLEWFASRGVYQRVKRRKPKQQPGQGRREVDFDAGLKEQIIEIDPDLWAEYEAYKKALFQDAARKRNNLVIGEVDREIIFSHDLGINPDTGKTYHDPKVYWASKAFREAKDEDLLRPDSQIIKVPYELGDQPLMGAPRISARLESDRAAAALREQKQDQAALDEEAMFAYYEDLARNDDAFADGFSDELVEQVKEDLVEEFGPDFDMSLVAERLRQANPVVDDQPGINLDDVYDQPEPDAAARAEMAAEAEPEFPEGYEPTDEELATLAAEREAAFRAEDEAIAEAELAAEAEPEWPERFDPTDEELEAAARAERAQEEGIDQAELEAERFDEPEDDFDVSQYEVSEAEHIARQRERDEAEYLAYQKAVENPVREEALNEADAATTETLVETQMDFELQYRLVGEEGLKESVDNILRERVLRGRNLRKLRRDAGIKMLIGTGIVFGNPVMGAAWGMMSYLSKHRRINAAAQQKAALAYGSAMRQQGRQMLDEVVSPEDMAVARALKSDAEFIQGLIDDEVRNASKIKSALVQADELMDQAGFPSLQIGNMSFRSAFGDDQRYNEQIHRQVSANGGMSAVYSGVHRHQKREMERFTKSEWERKSYTDLRVPRDPDKLDSKEFAENFDRLANLYTSSANSKPFYKIVWSNRPIEERVDELYKLFSKDRDLLRHHVNDRGQHAGAMDDIGNKELKIIAQNIVTEYENVLPTQHFADLRGRARAGKFTWEDVERRLDKLIDDGTLLQGVEIKRYQNKRMEAVRELQEAGWKGFGKAIAPKRSMLNDSAIATAGKKVNDLSESLFLRWGALPSDELARHPFFKSVYEREMRRTIEPMLDEDGYVNISQKQIDRIENSARNVALEETKRVLYELGESSRLSELLGNAAPFFNAWQEVLSRWAGFAVDNPMFVGNVGRLYRKPWEAEALGLGQFEDENGNTYVTLRLFGDAFDEDGNQSTIFDVMPQSVKDVFIPPILSDSESTMRFSKDGINTMMQITPGAGPLVVIPAREAVLANPELETTLSFLFPFGHPQSSNFLERVVVSNLPTWQKATYDLTTNHTHSRDAVTARMFQDVVLELQARGEFIDWADEGVWNELQEEAEKRANQFFMFRIGAGLFSPTSTTWQSPYQPYMDAYNELEKKYDWRTAQTMFLDRYGEEFYAATATFTKSNDGVSSSLEAERLYNEYQELIQGEGRAVGDWITGSMGSTAERYAFSQSVFYNQMNMPVAPGSDEMRRERKSGREAIEDTQIQLGWRTYTEGKNFVRMHQDRAVAAGMSPSLNANHMQGIAAWWRAYKDELIQSNATWANEFNDIFGQIDRTNEALEGFIAGLHYQELRDRPSSRHLLEYLEARMFLQGELEDRKAAGGSAVLTASANNDLFDWWEQKKYDFGTRPEFEALFDRYFERDVVDPATWLGPDELPPGWFV